MKKSLKGHAGLFFQGYEIDWMDDGIYYLTDYEVWMKVIHMEVMESLMKSGHTPKYIQEADLTTEV